MCRRLYEQGRLAAKLMSGAPKVIARVCPLLIARDVDAACANVAAWRGRGYSVQKCSWEFHSLLGAGDVCRNWPRPASDVCDGTAALRRSKEPGGSCGGDPICRALSGEGVAACGALDARLRALSCPISER
jgi:hypothetical protein